MAKIMPEYAFELGLVDKFDNPKNQKFIPVAKTAGSMAMDLRSTESFIIKPYEAVSVPTGIEIKYCTKDIGFDVEMRSGGRFNSLMSSLGTGYIDSDYPGEIAILVMNFSKKNIYIKKGDRFAQIKPVYNLMKLAHPKHRSAADRLGGFGSTGLK